MRADDLFARLASGAVKAHCGSADGPARCSRGAPRAGEPPDGRRDGAGAVTKCAAARDRMMAARVGTCRHQLTSSKNRARFSTGPPFASVRILLPDWRN